METTEEINIDNEIEEVNKNESEEVVEEPSDTRNVRHCSRKVEVCDKLPHLVSVHVMNKEGEERTILCKIIVEPDCDAIVEITQSDSMPTTLFTAAIKIGRFINFHAGNCPTHHRTSDGIPSLSHHDPIQLIKNCVLFYYCGSHYITEESIVIYLNGCSPFILHRDYYSYFEKYDPLSFQVKI